MFESDYDCFYSKLVFLKTVCPKITYFNKLTEFQKLIRLYMVAQREIQYVALANRRMYKDELSGKNRNVIMLPKRNIITENIVVVSLSLELYYFNLELGNCLFGSVIGTTLIFVKFKTTSCVAATANPFPQLYHLLLIY